MTDLLTTILQELSEKDNISVELKYRYNLKRIIEDIYERLKKLEEKVT